MQIVNSTLADIPFMLDLYDIAREYQQQRSLQHWLDFDPVLLKKEIEEQRQWKILEDDAIACIFLTAYEDPFIWKEKNKDPSVYIHRIVTNPLFRGHQYTNVIIDWARIHGKERDKRFIRMDTWGDNQKLLDYYIKCGFNFLGVITPEVSPILPKHYSGITLSLLEIEII